LVEQGKSVFHAGDRSAVAELAQSFGDCRETERLRGDRYLLTIPQLEKVIGTGLITFSSWVAL
jgi:hypothetical protein